MRIRNLLLLVFTLISAAPPALPGSTLEFRGLWVDPSGYSTAQAADKLIENCRKAGLNAVVANVMAHGAVYHKSPHFLHRVAATDQFDPLAYLTHKAHAAGIEVHAWYCVYYEGGSTLTPARPDWVCCDFDGKRMGDGQIFLSPAVSGVNEYLLSVIQDALAYDIDGIHLDYIRYAGTPYDYSPEAREWFCRERSFDPIDLLDHTERVVPPQKEPFPVRMLHPEKHKVRPWETTRIESLLDRAGIGFGWISEKPENVDSLRIPGLLILGAYYEVPAEMVAAIERYSQRGGQVLWIDAPTTTLAKSKELQRLLGTGGGTRWTPERWVSLTPATSDPMARVVPRSRFRTFSNSAFEPREASVAARFDSGDPAILTNQVGKGRVVLVNFHAGAASGDAIPTMIRGIVCQIRTQSGVAQQRDYLAARRAQWIRWRADRVTDLVRKVRQSAKAKDGRLDVSVAGGFAGSEYYTVYRDGRKWLAEGLLDFACPMDYAQDLDVLREMLDEHRAIAPSGTADRIYPGLALYSRKLANGKQVTVPRDAALVRDQLRMVKEKGYRGFVLFSSVQLTEDQIRVIAKF